MRIFFAIWAVISSKNFRGDGLKAVAACWLRETFSLSTNFLNDQMIQMTK